MVIAKVTVSGLDQSLKIAPEIEKFTKRLPKRMNTSVSLRLGRAIRDEALKRAGMGGWGVTEKMETRSNWEVHSREIRKGVHVSSVSNDEAPYAGYLDDPDGGYPLTIDVGELEEWMDMKYKGNKSVFGLMEQILTEGHNTKTWKGFLGQALANAVVKAGGDFGKNVDMEFEKINLKS